MVKLLERKWPSCPGQQWPSCTNKFSDNGPIYIPAATRRKKRKTNVGGSGRRLAEEKGRLREETSKSRVRMKNTVIEDKKMAFFARMT
jgi:hypothetical protein